MTVDTNTTQFTHAIEVINRSIRENRQNSSFAPVFNMLDNIAEGTEITAAVYKTEPEQPYDYYTLLYNNGQFAVTERGKRGDTPVTWRVPQDFLNDLAEDPDRYVENPMLIDWDWLKARIGG